MVYDGGPFAIPPGRSKGGKQMGTRRRILVVDDDPIVRNQVRAVLEHTGYEVITARDGREAISLISHDDYDVVLLDVAMPKLDGLSVVDELRKTNNPVLSHTYLMAAGEPDDLLDLPVRGVIAKPFDFSRLVAETKDCIGH